MNTVPSGWYPDPEGLADERYHDGRDWTDQTRTVTSVGHAEPTVGRPNGSGAVQEDALLAEQRRTTHAVRAIAFFVLILLPTQFVGVALIYWGLATQAACGNYCSSYEPDGVPQLVLGGVVMLGGIVVAIVQGWSELVASGRATK